MNTIEALKEMETNKEFGDFKVNTDPQMGRSIRYDFVKKDSIADKWKQIIDAFGEQDWVRVKEKGYCPKYIPASISRDFAINYRSMLCSFAEYGCD